MLAGSLRVAFGCRVPVRVPWFTPWSIWSHIIAIYNQCNRKAPSLGREIVDNNRYAYGSGHELIDNNRYAYGSGREIGNNNRYAYGSGQELINNNIYSYGSGHELVDKYRYAYGLGLLLTGLFHSFGRCPNQEDFLEKLVFQSVP